MTAIVLARTPADALEIADRWGLRDWIYPHQPATSVGVEGSMIVYVERWEESRQLTPAGVKAAYLRTALDAPEVEAMTVAQMVRASGPWPERASRILAAKLVRAADQLVMISPEIMASTKRPAKRRWWRRG